MCLSEYIFFLSQEANKTSKVMLWCMKTTILATCKIIFKKERHICPAWKSTQRFWEHLQQLPVVPSRPPCFVLAGLHGVTFGCWLHVNWYSVFSCGVTVARLKIVGQIRHQANQPSDGCRKREASVKKKKSLNRGGKMRAKVNVRSCLMWRKEEDLRAARQEEPTSAPLYEPEGQSCSSSDSH